MLEHSSETRLATRLRDKAIDTTLYCAAARGLIDPLVQAVSATRIDLVSAQVRAQSSPYRMIRRQTTLGSGFTGAKRAAPPD